MGLSKAPANTSSLLCGDALKDSCLSTAVEERHSGRLSSRFFFVLVPKGAERFATSVS